MVESVGRRSSGVMSYFTLRLTGSESNLQAPPPQFALVSGAPHARELGRLIENSDDRTTTRKKDRRCAG
jgi:hypothetical protein